VAGVLDQCGQRGTRWAVIEAAGFQELGAEGLALEEEIVKVCAKHGMRFIGPNCLGFVNTANALNVLFAEFAEPLNKGKVAVIAQSGGIGSTIATKLCYRGLGISKFISMGNKLDLDEADYLEYLADDPETEVICCYLEGFKRARKIAEVAKRCKKPIVLLKGNTGALSSTIAASHTAALAADDSVVDGVCRECGILRAHSPSEAACMAGGLSLQPLKGKNLAILSRSGGHAVVATDTCANLGLRLPALPGDILDEAQRASKGVIKLGNPLDLGDIFDMAVYARVIERLLASDVIDGIVFMMIIQLGKPEEFVRVRELYKQLMDLSARYEKPIAVMVELPLEIRVKLYEIQEPTPFFLDIVEAVKTLGTNGKRYEYYVSQFESTACAASGASDDCLSSREAKDWFQRIASENRQPLLHEALQLMDYAGIRQVPWRMARDVDSAVKAAEELGYPLAVKAVAPSLLHKSDKGAIALNVGDAETLRKEWERLEAISSDFVCMVLQKMAVKSSRELVIGGKRDESFGPVIMLGMGGVLVEVLKDATIRLAPTAESTALQMFDDLAGKRLLGQFRGLQAADLDMVSRIIAKASRLMAMFPEIEEMDLNPVSISDDGKSAIALDARVLIRQHA
jgi:acetyltransferase